MPSATLAWIPSLGPEVTKSGQKGGYSGRGPNMTQNDLFCLMSLLGLSIGRVPKWVQNHLKYDPKPPLLFNVSLRIDPLGGSQNDMFGTPPGANPKRDIKQKGWFGTLFGRGWDPPQGGHPKRDIKQKGWFGTPPGGQI